MRRMPRLICSLLVLFTATIPAVSEAKPLRVFILAGQSNMEGHAKVETFDYIGDDPATAPLLKQMRGADGKPTVCEGVWISYLTGSRAENGEGHGKLTAGYGSRRNPKEDGGKIGPEFTFGLTMDAAFDEPVLIIKTAWGGKSLHTDFRSPSAGPYVFNETQLANFRRQGRDIDAVSVTKENETGCYYRLMLEHVRHVLSDIKRVCPAYDEQQGFEISGFVWLQGWNDLVDSGVYPNRHKPGGYDAYSTVMAHFIRDVRRRPECTAHAVRDRRAGGRRCETERADHRVPQGDGRAGIAAGIQRQRARRRDLAVLVRGTRSHREQARQGASDEHLPQFKTQRSRQRRWQDDRPTKARIRQGLRGETHLA